MTSTRLLQTRAKRNILTACVAAALLATGKISCTMGKEAPRMCDVGVFRGKPGQAQVQITLPMDMKRTLTFAGNQVTADSNASRPATVKSRKQADEWTVEVNDFETFRIPDAVINGG
jgi:hypothetical protein